MQELASISAMHEESLQLADNEMEPALRLENAPMIGDHSIRGYLEEANEASTSHIEAPDVLPEMPPSHPDIDLTALTKEKLIQACAHFAAIAAIDPAAADRMAGRTIESKRQEAELREQGVDAATIRKQQWSSMLKRHREKTSTDAAPKISKTADKPTAEPAPQTALEAPRAAFIRTGDQVVVQQMPELHAMHASTEERAKEGTVAPLAPDPLLQAHAHAADTVPIQEATFSTIHDRRVIDEPVEAAARLTTEGSRQHQSTEMVTKHTVDMGRAATHASEHHSDASILEQSFLDDSDSPEEALHTELAPDLTAITLPLAEHHSYDNQQQDTAEIAEGRPADYEYFTGALQAVVTAAQELAPADQVAQHNEVALTMETVEPAQDISIAAAVAEQLATLELEQKTELEPLLADIIKDIHAINVLETLDTDPKTIEVATQLEESIGQLFEQLGIAYDQADVESFIAIILRPDFQPQPFATQTSVDLEHDGTHEAKIHFAQFMSRLSAAEETAEQLLGRLVVFHAAPRSSNETTLLAA